MFWRQNFRHKIRLSFYALRIFYRSFFDSSHFIFLFLPFFFLLHSYFRGEQGNLGYTPFKPAWLLGFRVTPSRGRRENTQRQKGEQPPDTPFPVILFKAASVQGLRGFWLENGKIQGSPRHPGHALFLL
jgi:hypothetical protein